jgi:hypothetical protein
MKNKTEDVLFLVYSLNDLKMVYRKEVDLGHYSNGGNKWKSAALDILINSKKEVFALYRYGRIDQLDVLFQFQ